MEQPSTPPPVGFAVVEVADPNGHRFVQLIAQTPYGEARYVMGHDVARELAKALTATASGLVLPAAPIAAL